MNVIDCTIRDGGHLNKWDFDPALVVKAYEAACLASFNRNSVNKIRYFEIGYRFPSSMEGLGPFGYCTDEYISKLIPTPSENCPLCVMIDSSKCDVNQFDVKRNSPFTAVRVACYPDELSKAMRQVEVLYKLGYDVFLNPMVTIGLKPEHFEMLHRWRFSLYTKAIYIADSFGNFDEENFSYLSYMFQKCLPGRHLGFHAHNNLGRALENTLFAAKNPSVFWVDATIAGLGRGAGNTPMELLLDSPLSKLQYMTLTDEFIKIKEKYGCGLSAHTLLGGMVGIHPYYAEELFKYSDNIFILHKLAEEIKVRLPISFSKDKFVEFMKEKGFK